MPFMVFPSPASTTTAFSLNSDKRPSSSWLFFNRKNSDIDFGRSLFIDLLYQMLRVGILLLYPSHQRVWKTIPKRGLDGQRCLLVESRMPGYKRLNVCSISPSSTCTSICNVAY